MRLVRLKRLAAVILALPLLHLNVARAAIACDRHEDDTAGTESTSHDAHAGHAPHHEQTVHELQGGEPDASPEHRPVDDATSTECCQALASCSFAFGGVGGESLPGSFAAHVARPASVADAPPSRIRSPEPPPPKA